MSRGEHEPVPIPQLFLEEGRVLEETLKREHATTIRVRERDLLLKRLL